MRSSSTAGFCKSEACPSTEMLLLYTEARLARVAQRKITTHLSGCDFCGAEMFLLARHGPQPDKPTSPTETFAMPASLRRLAEDVFSKMKHDMTVFASLTSQRERLTLTDA